MKTRKLRNLKVSAVGFGAMGLSHGYAAIPTPAEGATNEWLNPVNDEEYKNITTLQMYRYQPD